MSVDATLHVHMALRGLWIEIFGTTWWHAHAGFAAYRYLLTGDRGDAADLLQEALFSPLEGVAPGERMSLDGVGRFGPIVPVHAGHAARAERVNPTWMVQGLSRTGTVVASVPCVPTAGPDG
jgi:hypothetical protein